VTKLKLEENFFYLERPNIQKKKFFNFSLIFKLIRKHFSTRKIKIACYHPSNYEVNISNFTEKAMKKNFKIALPVIGTRNTMSFRSWKLNEPLNVNQFGILEPKKTNKKIIPDLILVPLVAFDKRLNRIGYGGGYYDRILKKIKKNKRKAVSLGIAYSYQECNNVPINKYDFKLDYIFTERGIISSN